MRSVLNGLRRMKVVIILCLVSLVFSAPAPQQKNTIDFLLELNEDILDDGKETPASVEPIPQSLVGTTTADPEEIRRIVSSPEFEEQADVRETSQKPAPIASHLNNVRDRSSEEPDYSDEKNQESDFSDEGNHSGDGHEEQGHREPSNTNELGIKEDTTIRVYDEQDDVSTYDGNQEKEEEQVREQINGDVRETTDQELNQHSKHQSNAQEQGYRSDQFQPDIQLAIVPGIDLSSNNDASDDQQDVRLKPDQLFNHGTIVFDKTTFEGKELDFSTTTPFSAKKWNHDHGHSFGEWHNKFGPFKSGPDTRFDGMPPPWANWHNHDHEHHHDHDHEHDHGHRGHWHDHSSEHHRFHGHGFHRGGPWKWN